MATSLSEGPRGRVITGARARLLVNNVKIGYVTGLDVSLDISIEAVEPIDTIVAEELVTTGLRCSWSARMVRVYNQNEFGEVWFQSFDELTRGGRELSMHVLDTVEDEVVHALNGVKVGQLSFNVEGRSLAARNISGQARYSKLETQPNLRG